MSSKRFDYLDIAKGIGILMVVWAHIMLVGASHRIIYAFHMPLFFFISGMLFNKDKFENFGQFIKHRAKRLLVPYVVYSFVTWCLWAGFRYISHDHVDSYIMPLLQTFIAQGSGEYFVHNSALWFIPCLFAVEILYYLFSRFNECVTLVLCFVAAGLGWLSIYLFGNKYLFLLPWNLDAAFFALPFYGVANSLKRHCSHEKFMTIVAENRFAVATCVAVLFILLSDLAMRYGECSMGSSSYQCIIPIFFIRAFLGCFALVGLSALICSLFNNGVLYNSIKWCGKSSLDIMCLHIPIKGIAIIFVTKLIHPLVNVQESIIYSGLVFALTMIVLVPIIMSINKFVRK